jgi:hypothetical protein
MCCTAGWRESQQERTHRNSKKKLSSICNPALVVVLLGEPCRCSREFMPVCFNGKTYSNRCLAKCDGAKEGDIAAGSCNTPVTVSTVTTAVPAIIILPTGQAVQTTLPAITTTPTPAPVPGPAPGDCVCTLEYKPVCHKDKQYSNRCIARCDGAADSEITNGPCTAPGATPAIMQQVVVPATPTPPCVCSKELVPVCYKGNTYSNACLARCAGALPADIKGGACAPVQEVGPATTLPAPVPKPPCKCTRELNPVCSRGVTYDNPCLAICNGATDASTTPGPCATNVTTLPATLPAKPAVLPAKPEGNGTVPQQPAVLPTKPEGNATAPLCRCTLELIEVCYNGKTFANACLAKCEGATDADIKQGACASPATTLPATLPTKPAVQPAVLPAKPETNMTQPAVLPAKPETNMTQPAVLPAKPETNMTQPAVLPAKPESNTTQQPAVLPVGPAKPAVLPAANVTQPAVLPAKPESNITQQPAVLPAKPESNTTQQPAVLPVGPAKPAVLPAANVSQPAVLPAKPESNTTQQPAVLPAKPESNTTQQPAVLPVGPAKPAVLPAANVSQPAVLPAKPETNTTQQPAVLPVGPAQGSTCVCTREFRQVCFNNKTFGNPCLAKCEGATDATIKPGACPAPAAGGAAVTLPAPLPTGNTSVTAASDTNSTISTKPATMADQARTEAGCVCTMEFRPVCVSGKQYSNPCVARCAGALERDIVTGPCKGVSTAGIPVPTAGP